MKKNDFHQCSVIRSLCRVGAILSLPIGSALAGPGYVSKDRDRLYSPPVVEQPVARYDTTHPALLARIRFPLSASDEALTTLRLQWEDSARREDSRTAAQGPEYFNARVKDELNKSAFWALLFYESLRRVLPEDTVAIEGLHLVADPNAHNGVGAQATQDVLPAVLEIDFAVNRHFADFYGDETPVSPTFGEYVTPSFVIWTSRQAAATSNGVLISSTSAGGGGNNQFELDSRVSKAGVVPPWEISGATKGKFETCFFPSTQVRFARRGKTPLRLTPNRELYIPLTTFTLAEEVMQALATADSYAALAAAIERVPLLHYLKALSIHALNDTDAYLALQNEWRDYVSMYDQHLAARWPSDRLSADEQLRLAAIKRFMRTERRLTSLASQQVSSALLQGSFARGMQAQLLAEQEFLSQMRKTHQKMWFSRIVGALTLGATGQGGSYASFYDLFATTAEKRTAGHEALSHRLDEALRTGARASFSEFQQVVIEGQDTQVSSIADLRHKMRVRYGALFANRNLERCLPTTQQLKQILGIDDPSRVEWFGACEGGSAAGYGLLRANNSEIELQLQERTEEPYAYDVRVFTSHDKQTGNPLRPEDLGRIRCEQIQGAGNRQVGLLKGSVQYALSLDASGLTKPFVLTDKVGRDGNLVKGPLTGESAQQLAAQRAAHIEVQRRLIVLEP
jgi:hypothetical protein